MRRIATIRTPLAALVAAGLGLLASCSTAIVGSATAAHSGIISTYAEAPGTGSSTPAGPQDRPAGTASGEQLPGSGEANCVGCAPVTTGVVTAEPSGTKEISDADAKAVINLMLTQIQDFWNSTYRDVFNEPTRSELLVALATDDQAFACGTEVLTGTYSPSYCFLNDTLAAPIQVMKDAADKGLLLTDGSTIDPAGAIGVFFLLAHEWGHNVSLELITQFGGLPTLQKVPAVEQENFADCAAGLAIAGVEMKFNQADATAVLTFAGQAGEPAGGTHGTPEQRRAALAMGMNHAVGDPKASAAGLGECVSTQAPTLYSLMHG